jgi:lipopolysaccharide export system permease protein
MFRARILDRYILREFLPPFFLSIAVLTLALFLQKMFRLIEFVISKGSSLAATGKLLLYILPSFLMLTLPISLLVATLTAFSRLSSDSEVTAMKSSRISLYAMIMPVLQFAFVLFLITASIAHFLVPHANFAFKAQLFDMIKSKALVGLEQGVFSSAFDGTVIYVDRMNSADDMQGIFISDERSQQEPYAVTAARGRLITNPENLSVTLVLERGSVHVQPRKDGSYSFITFDAARLYLDINRAWLRSQGDSGRDLEEMDSLELMRSIRTARASGASPRPAEIEIQKRMSVSYACLIFGLVGAPLGIRKARSGRSAGIAIAIGIILLYYVVLGTAENLARNGTLSPMAATWVPNGLITAAAVALTIMKAQEVSFGISSRIGALLRRAVSRLRRTRGA